MTSSAKRCARVTRSCWAGVSSSPKVTGSLYPRPASAMADVPCEGEKWDAGHMPVDRWAAGPAGAHPAVIRLLLGPLARVVDRVERRRRRRHHEPLVLLVLILLRLSGFTPALVLSRHRGLQGPWRGRSGQTGTEVCACFRPRGASVQSLRYARRISGPITSSSTADQISEPMT